MDEKRLDILVCEVQSQPYSVILELVDAVRQERQARERAERELSAAREECEALRNDLIRLRDAAKVYRGLGDDYGSQYAREVKVRLDALLSSVPK